MGLRSHWIVSSMNSSNTCSALLIAPRLLLPGWIRDNITTAVTRGCVANMPQLCVTAYGCIVRCSLRTTCIVSQIDYCLRPQRRRWLSTAGGRRMPRGVISNVQYIYRTVLTGRQKNTNAVIINAHLCSHSEHTVLTDQS
jgi:hypothetical protein